MPRDWDWDETLFRGSAPFYVRGRLPYPAGLAAAMVEALDLNGVQRLIDVGCGPGLIALLLAPWCAEVVGVDPDPDMLVEAEHAATARGIDNARWVCARAEDLPLGLGVFSVATFAQSFHWMQRERVAAVVYDMLEPRGAFVQVSANTEPTRDLPEVQALVRQYLGADRRAGQGVLRFGTPGDEHSVLRQAGFGEAEIVRVPGGALLERDVEDVVAAVFANSASAPHLFGDRLAEFESELRHVLGDTPNRTFVTPDVEVRIWRK